MSVAFAVEDTYFGIILYETELLTFLRFKYLAGGGIGKQHQHFRFIFNEGLKMNAEAM